MRLTAIVAVVSVLALGAGVVFAQTPAPNVTINASESSLAVGASGPLASGPTRFEIVKSGQGELEIAIAALRTGVTVDQFTAALRQNADAALELIHLDGGASLTAADERRAVTMSLRANTTYVVANITGE